MAVSTLKKGAVDFIEKPFDQAALRSLIERMLQEARQRKAKAEQRSLNDALLSKLTPREQHVLERIVSGRLNKQIAADLAFPLRPLKLIALPLWIRPIPAPSQTDARRNECEQTSCQRLRFYEIVF